uniref:Uncharacterized protein n=1 Tax=Eutreptiella gymnastica TaxID=73025 RepID=A0A7S1NI54_9EUGL|mmetsp:Transcript_34371/g.61595  ORF Transcript_34371/g.61595 Transcript_34371/m.61595 type:complete len:221 (+) Transcript_34371:88-750(+)
MIVQCLDEMARLQNTDGRGDMDTALRKLQYLVGGTCRYGYITEIHTPLTMAISYSNPQAAHVILETCPNLVNLPTRPQAAAMSSFPLLQAVRYMRGNRDHWERLVSDLLDNPDIDVNVATSAGETALHMAAKTGLIAVVDKLLNNGACRTAMFQSRTAEDIALIEMKTAQHPFWPDRDLEKKLQKVVCLLQPGKSDMYPGRPMEEFTLLQGTPAWWRTTV